ncbi:long-chain-fatty-acid--CoA ligase [Alkalihalobacterium chitinilyticum]|nr:long-chain fatty acid--CoA ligase [Alkalihalobacterium chitinilyticum]
MMEKVWLNQYPDEIKTTVDIPVKTIPDILKETTQKYPQHIALTFYGNEMTYEKLAQLSQAFASALQGAGVNKDDRVAIMLPNCPQFVISYYGILTAGAIVTQVNPMLVERELAHILIDSGAETIVVFDALYPRFKAVQEQTKVKNVIVVSFGEPPSLEEDLSFEQFLGTAKSFTPPKFDPEQDVAVLQYTGGTTGRSKGAMLTHRNLMANLEQVYEFFKNDFEVGKERTLTVIPLFHVFGMTSCMNLAIYTAATNILFPRFDLQEVLETIKKEKPTTFPGVPTMYVAITNHPNAQDYGIDSIRICNSGSAPMPIELMKDFEAKTGAKILEGYGLSETAPTTHVNPMFSKRKPGSVGIGIPSTEYKIVDVASGTEEVPAGETGEVIIRGPQVMKGYWNMPEETEHTLRNGWLYTGDIGKVDEEGYLYIVDRKKDMIIASGFNIYPRDIEEVLYEHEAVQEAVVIGVPDPYRGETVKAVIVLKQGKTADEQEMMKYCQKNLAAYKVPKIIEFRDELPKTSVGKILRRTLREEHQEDKKMS